MARAALNWSVDYLAEQSGEDPAYIAAFEAGADAPPDFVSPLRRTFESHRVRFLMNGEFAGAVVPPKPLPGDDSGENPIVQGMIERARNG